MQKLIRKSANATAKVAAGTNNLGKYTLLLGLELLIKLLDASEKATETKVRGSIPANTINA